MEREDKNKCWVALVYDWGDEGLPIVCSRDADLLRLVKKKVIKEARDRARISAEIDPIVAVLDEAEFRRVSRVLDILVPDDDHDYLAEDIRKG